MKRILFAFVWLFLFAVAVHVQEKHFNPAHFTKEEPAARRTYFIELLPAASQPLNT